MKIANKEISNGFIKFGKKNWSYKGDKGTWARFNEETNEITINLAGRGIISSEYMNELTDFATAIGAKDEFDKMVSGDRITVKI